MPPNSRMVIPANKLSVLHDTDSLLKAQNALAQNTALKDHVNSLKPDVAAVPSNFQVYFGDNSTELNGKTQPEMETTSSIKKVMKTIFICSMKYGSSHHQNDTSTKVTR